jgi:hypothetical protein
MSPPPDNRLMQRGEPADQIVLHRGWLTVRRADGPAGVVLEIRIPGCPHENQPHEDQASAIMAASAAWSSYCQAVKGLAS